MYGAFVIEPWRPSEAGSPPAEGSTTEAEREGALSTPLGAGDTAAAGGGWGETERDRTAGHCCREGATWRTYRLLAASNSNGNNNNLGEICQKWRSSGQFFCYSEYLQRFFVAQELYWGELSRLSSSSQYDCVTWSFCCVQLLLLFIYLLFIRQFITHVKSFAVIGWLSKV